MLHMSVSSYVTYQQVHAIPLKAIELGLLTVPKKGKINAFSGKVLEIEGLDNLKVEQAFELSDASAERSAAGCTIKVCLGVFSRCEMFIVVSPYASSLFSRTARQGADH